MISKSCLDKVLERADKNSIKFSKLTSPLKINLGDTSFTECKVKVNLENEIECDLYQLDLLILESLPYEVLFGMDFILLYDVLIRTASKTILIDPDQVTSSRWEIPQNYFIRKCLYSFFLRDCRISHEK